MHPAVVAYPRTTQGKPVSIAVQMGKEGPGSPTPSEKTLAVGDYGGRGTPVGLPVL